LMLSILDRFLEIFGCSSEGPPGVDNVDESLPKKQNLKIF